MNVAHAIGEGDLVWQTGDPVRHRVPHALEEPPAAMRMPPPLDMPAARIVTQIQIPRPHRIIDRIRVRATNTYNGQGLYPSAKRMAIEDDKKHVTKDYRNVLDQKDVDMVVVASPDHWHAKMTIDLFLHGASRRRKRAK